MTPVVTHHAVVRFAERVLGIPTGEFSRLDLSLIEEMRATIAVVTRRGVLHGASAVVYGGQSYILSGRYVVTILPGRHRAIQRQSGRARQRIVREERWQEALL